MTSTSKNKALFIDQEAHSTLALVQEGGLRPIDKLMNQQEAYETDRDKKYKGVSFPFSFVLAPKGRRNKEVMQRLKKGESVDLIVDGLKVGDMRVDEVFPIDPLKRLESIYGTRSKTHPGVKSALKRLGDLAISGKYNVESDNVLSMRKMINDAKQRSDAKKTSAIMIAANPLHRALERVIRQSLDQTDLLVLFLLKPFNSTSGLDYDLRYKTLKHFVDNYLPKNKVVIVPLENTYIFAGFNEMVIDTLVAKNFGCDEIITGINHAGLGVYYDKNEFHSIFDRVSGIDIDIKTLDEFSYCEICKTLISAKTCPHGHHHHISYHSDSILQLIRMGIMPPAVLVRSEISALILSSLFPNRFKDMQKLYYDIMPKTGLLEKQNDKDFYMNLMKLYQTASLN
ncbi:MAG: sulfate adenylyltransferase [Campylobacterota bacterium]